MMESEGDEEQRFRRIAEKVFWQKAFKIGALCLAFTSFVIDRLYGFGMWLHDNSPAVKAAYEAFEKISGVTR